MRTLLALLSTAAGCTEELPSPALVTKLRLLALTADAPEVLFGTDVRVRAVWHDGSARAGRPVHFAWRLCGEEAAREPRLCLRPERGVDVGAGAASEGADVLALPAARLPLAPGAHATTYLVLLAMCPDAPPAFDGVLGQYVCPAEEGVAPEQREGIQAVRRIVVRDDPAALNHNPGVVRVLLDGRELVEGGEPLVVSRCPAREGAVAPCRAFEVRAAPGSVERRGDGRDENLLASFFVTAGSVDRPRAVASEGHPLGDDGSLSTRWAPPATAQMVRLWAVLRDGRGGDVVRGPVLVHVE